jgi:hypothetical protein
MVESMFRVQTQIQANGREWSSFTSQTVNTGIQSNMREFSSAFSPSSTNPLASIMTSTPPAAATPTIVNVVVQGTVTSSEDLKKSIQDAINDAGTSGRQTITGSRDRMVAI